ncbi:MAG: hypothetical protein OXG24_07190 [Gammaproteobacteria bacterium]|nr:hypothetical protein [Gammaproteobacteria bacterium]
MSDDLSSNETRDPSYKGEKKWFQPHASWLTEAAATSVPGSRSKELAAQLDTPQGLDASSLSSHQVQMFRIWNQLSSNHQLVARFRFARKPNLKTLEFVGEKLGLTRERVRQIQVRISQIIDEALEVPTSQILSELRASCGEMATEKDFQASLDKILGTCEETWDQVYAVYLEQKSDYKSTRGVRASTVARKFISEARKVLPNTKEARLIDLKTIRNVDSSFWYKYRDLIVKCLGIALLPNGSLATRDTMPMRVVDALTFLGTPATKEELSELTGLSTKTLLARLWCMDEVVKVANNMWALSSPEAKKYVGVVDMIQNILEEQGGECSVRFLRDRIRERCNVKPSSMNTFLATSQFVVSNGRARLRQNNEVKLRPLSQVIDGRLTNGAPYWTFTVQQRHLKGNSVTGFPPEFANELGIEPNSYDWVKVERPSKCRDLKVTWHLSSANGIHVGYVREALESLNCTVGQIMRLIVRHRRIEIQRHV